jgi:site-specific recombinase XerC
VSNYASRGRAPVTLTDEEQIAILKVTGEHARGLRDHLIIGLGMGAGMREHEIAALDVIDVVAPPVQKAKHGIKAWVELRVFKGHRRAGAEPQWVRLPDELRRKIGLFVRREHRGTLLTTPLFVSRDGGGRIATRTIRHHFRKWQELAGFDRLHGFHRLRHTYVTAVYAATKDLAAAQQLARHARVDTTRGYVHLGNEILDRASKRLRC